MLTGEAKKIYQRNYMRNHRASLKTANVRPVELDFVRPVKEFKAIKPPEIDADGNVIPEY